MTTLIEAARQALEALEIGWSPTYVNGVDAREKGMKAITSLRQAIEAAEKQEPVATVVSENKPVTMSWWHEPALPVGTKLYTTPPTAPVQEPNYKDLFEQMCQQHDMLVDKLKAAQREWVGLTDEDKQIAVDSGCMSSDWVFYGAAVERALKKKNT
jgi:hypothetical protein